MDINGTETIAHQHIEMLLGGVGVFVKSELLDEYDIIS